MRVVTYLFSVHFCLCSYLFFFARDYLEIRVYMARLTYSSFLFNLSLLLFSSPSFSSCHALILSRCSALIYCGILYFERRLHVLIRLGVDNMTMYATLYTLISISISALSSPTMTCEQTQSRALCVSVSEPRREATYRSDDNISKSASAGQDRLTFVAAKLQMESHFHSLSQSTVS